MVHNANWICLVMLVAVGSLPALSASPIGEWYAYDDNCLRRSIVKIYERKDKTLAGTVVKLLNPAEGESEIKPICTQCSGDKKGKSKIGMDVFWGLKKNDSKGNPSWEGGTVVNTDDGRTYSCKLWMKSEDTLILRGHMWIFGKSLEWTRVPKADADVKLEPENDPTIPGECLAKHREMMHKTQGS